MKELTKKYANIKEMLNDGFTKDDISELANGPRSKEADWDEDNTFFKWPYINGISTVGLFSLLNDKEKKAYNAYHKKHGPNGTRTGVISEEKKKVITKCDDLIKYIQEHVPEEKQAEGIALVMALRPIVKNSIVQELFGVEDVAKVTTKVTKAWIMYRGPSGERGSNPGTFSLKDALKAWGEDVTCALTKAQVEEKLEKLKGQGIDIDKLVA